MIICFSGCSNVQDVSSTLRHDSKDEYVVAKTVAMEVPTTEEQIWNYLVNQYGNEYAAAAIMGNSDYEMALCPYRTEGDKEKDSNGEYPYSKNYTELVDSGEISRDDFTYSGPNGGGYGLFSWTSVGRKQNLYDYAKQRNCSIADWQMQLDFAYQEIIDRYYDLYCTLLTAKSVEEATESFGINFEQGVDIGYTLLKRIDIANEYYEKYGDPDFEPSYEIGELLPVNNSYDYTTREIEENIIDTNIYAYLAETVLEKNGYLDKEPTGYYGVDLKAAITELQKDYGIEQDGELDQETWNILENM